MIQFNTRGLAHFAAIAIGLSAFAAPAHALPGFGSKVHIATNGATYDEGGMGAFEASKTYSSYNDRGDGVTAYGAAEMWGGKLHSSSLSTQGSCIGGNATCSDQHGVVSTVAMWDTITFYQKEDGGPVENISLLPLFIDVDGHLSGEYSRAKFRYYLGYESNYSDADMPWIELGEGTYESLDSLFIPIGTAKMYVYFELQTAAEVTGRENATSLADFGNTLSFNWVLPDDLAYTSESGTFMSGGPAAVPEPTTWAMMLAGFGMVGLTLRGRRKPLCDFAERVCTI